MNDQTDEFDDSGVISGNARLDKPDAITLILSQVVEFDSAIIVSRIFRH